MVTIRIDGTENIMAMVLYLCVQANNFGVCLELDFLVVVEVRLSQ